MSMRSQNSTNNRNRDREALEPGRQLRAQEIAAYHAWREWPLFLALRRQELLAHQAEGALPGDRFAVATGTATDMSGGAQTAFAGAAFDINSADQGNPKASGSIDKFRAAGHQ